MSGAPLSRDELELLELLEQQDLRRRKWGSSEQLGQIDERERRSLLERQLAAARRAQRRRRRRAGVTA